MDQSIQKYSKIILDYIISGYRDHFHEPCNKRLKYPSFTSGINYASQIWDWGSWQCCLAMNQLSLKDIEKYQKGNIYNFFDFQDKEGRIPIVVSDVEQTWLPKFDESFDSNIAKPTMAIHMLEICKKYNDYKWIEPLFDKLVLFLNYYEKHQKHQETGLYYFIDDVAVGADNNPTIFYRPKRSTGFLLINCLMYQELLSASILAKKLGRLDYAKTYSEKARILKKAIHDECYDEVDGYYYSVDISLRPIDKNEWLHSGCPRHWKSLPIKITTWDGMLPMWANIATKSQAKRMVERYLNKEGLFANYGIRSLGKNEKMYKLIKSNNPSCWLGPIWINANYFTYIGLRNYGYDELADDLAKKTIIMLGKDLEQNGGFHEYYDPDTGEGMHGLGMHGWNFLVAKMINDLKGK